MKNAAEYSRDAFLTNPVASATDATGFAALIPENGSESSELTHMFKLPNRATGKRKKKNRSG